MAVSDVDYDSVTTFYVNPHNNVPGDLVSHTNNIVASNQNIVDALSTINKTLSDLNLGWAGKTSQEAKDFGDRWNAVMKELFGTEDEPSIGALNLIATGLYTAAGTFAQAEHALMDFFGNFVNALWSSTGGGSGGAPQSITDATMTAVTETW
ncbi:hypothetical protein GCM10023196_003880 [Actinoallomurus vinaceus]|uniref:WXG100 family type VII secretion target n=1 Tax=Actinoallomurus vinaceus TaxID=1080074 RepID=A0ABP8U1M0_9ACTN